jgi:lysozyme
MKISEKGLNLIKHFEGLHDGDLKTIGLQPKRCPAGIFTEGYGRAMRDKKGRFIKDQKTALANISIRTEAEAEAALASDVRVFEDIVKRRVKVKLTQNQFDAIVSHTYNTGGSQSLFNAVSRKAPAAEILGRFNNHYITAGGVIQRGLIERRRMEAQLFFNA